MESDKIELGKRAVACKGWQWMPGMRTISGRRLAVVFGESRTAAVLCDLRDDANSDTEELQGELPEVTDPATVGCLLALVRDAWSDPHIVAERGWDLAWGHGRPGPLGYWLTEAEMLVAALESAP